MTESEVIGVDIISIGATSSLVKLSALYESQFGYQNLTKDNTIGYIDMF